MKQAVLWLGEWLRQGGFVLLLLPLGVAGRWWLRLPAALRLLAAGLLSLLALQVLQVLVPPTAAITESVRWHLYTVVQTLFLGGFYLYTVRGRQRSYLGGVLLAFVLFAWLDWAWLEHNQPLYAYTHSLQSVVLLGLAVRHLGQLGRRQPLTWLENDPFFLVSSGIVMYFSAIVLLYVLALPYISAADAVGQNVVALLVSLVAFIQYSLFALAFYRAAQPSSSPCP